MRGCARCDHVVKKGWQYCPRCGFSLERKDFDMFSLMRNKFKKIDHLIENELEQGNLLQVEDVIEQELELPRNHATSQRSRKMAEKITKIVDPVTRVRRLTKSIVYTLKVPGVKSRKDIQIDTLEKTIEIKAYANHLLYFKVLQMSLPVKRYMLQGNELVIEFKPIG
ncbi:zinc ribbon domain-containing protein [Candidatus Woesearchaeota archaeon]|nr:zinc ribbon domain-containing protein [Candidatus Woesearchaeota archaeon]